MYGVTGEVVREYARWFVGCWDSYAVQQSDGSYRLARCPLSLRLLASHLAGSFTLGTYVLDAAGCCSFAVFDADQADGLARLLHLAQELGQQGVAALLEASRRGGHLWVWLAEPTLASLVRAWLGLYARAFEVELYPKQDGLRPGGIGSLVRLPLGIHRQSGGWYPFVVLSAEGQLVPVGETVADCCLWVGAHAQRVRVPVLRESAGETAAARGVLSAALSGGGRHQTIRAWCEAQDIRAVIGRYTQLDRRGVGRCPLPGHHSRGDVRPSLQVFEGRDPHWYCYTWGRAGTAFDFLCLYHGLSVRQAWERLQQGMLW